MNWIAAGKCSLPRGNDTLSEKDLLPKAVQPLKSPCISVCALNEDDICIGCFRSAREITLWTRMSNDERRKVLLAARERSRVNNPFAKN